MWPARLLNLPPSATTRGPQVDDSHAFVIEGGRHPVVEQALSRDGTPFVANDCDLSPPQETDAGRIWLITGPNMAGKVHISRQNALIAILAQMGSFVPAKHAHIGVVDRLFSRVGAADDLARGRSTFMVEMVETAAILNQAGERALVILDEIGRGTATFDGLSIAWATVEHLHDVNKCRALFATHFHELTALAGRLDRLHNATVRVKEWQGEVVFLHEVVAGAADRSYGIQVAKLAGLPASVIERAKVVLAKLEQEDRAAPKGFEDLPLFAAPSKPPHEMRGNRRTMLLAAALAALNPDDLSPREAMEALYVLKQRSWRRARNVCLSMWQLGAHGVPAFARDRCGPESMSMMNIADRKQATAPADAQRWLEELRVGIASARRGSGGKLFSADGLWRDVLAFTWTIQTMTGRPAIEAMLRERLARTKPKNFHIPARRTPPRWVTRAGTEKIEALFEFETAFGRCAGVVRLVPDPQMPSRLRAWTPLQHWKNSKDTRKNSRNARHRQTKARATSAPRTGATAWPKRALTQTTTQLSLVVGGGQAGLVDRRAPASARHRHADRRPSRAHRRQLAQALSFADTAQRSARQSPALSAVPADLSRLHSKGQAGELVRILRRSDGVEFLDGDRACRRQL